MPRCMYFQGAIEKLNPRAPGWLSRLSVRLQLSSWSCGLWVRAPCRALRWQLRAWSLLGILCLPLSAPTLLSLSLSLSKVINKQKLKNKEKKKNSILDSEVRLFAFKSYLCNLVYDLWQVTWLPKASVTPLVRMGMVTAPTPWDCIEGTNR